jgi:hypothetical protein
MCGTACADLTSDVHNCGACGHDCKIGTCFESACQPALLATASIVYGLASDGTNVYGLDPTGGVAYGCALAQCGSGGTMTTLRTGLGSPGTVLPVPSVGSVFISQATAGTVFSLTPAGVLKFQINVTGAAGTFGLTTDGTSLFTATEDMTLGIQKTPLAGGTPVTAFANTGGEIYYDSVSNAVFSLGFNRNILWKCTPGTTTCTEFIPLLPSQTGIFAVTVAGGRLVYTINGATTGLFTCPTTAATCNATALLSSPAYSGVFFMTADANNVYLWATPTGVSSNLYRCALAGCGGVATPLITVGPPGSSYSPSVMANDATAFYWSNNTADLAGRGIMRLLK